MRYRAEIGMYDSAVLRATPEIRDPALSLRHARAMAAVIRAAKALQKARWSQAKRTNWDAWAAAYDKAMTAHEQAVDLLVAVEKEVERG